MNNDNHIITTTTTTTATTNNTTNINSVLEHLPVQLRRLPELLALPLHVALRHLMMLLDEAGSMFYFLFKQS